MSVRAGRQQSVRSSHKNENQGPAGQYTENNQKASGGATQGRASGGGRHQKSPSISSSNSSSLLPGTGNSFSGAGNGGSKAVSGSTSNPDEVAAYMNDRLVYLLAKSIGSTAIVTIASGAQIKGILSGASSENLGVVLNQAEIYELAPGEERDSGNADEHYNELVILAKDLMDIFIEAPDLSPDDKEKEKDKKLGFQTDADISKRNGEYVERELQRWTPDASDTGLSLEESSSGSWDQFAVNKERFGVASTYDEHLYTTVIDKNHPEYHLREKRAEALAAEINSSSHGGNVHLAEERNQVIDDSGLDEEDKYSGVQRSHDQKAHLANGIPDDPAIISSSVAKVGSERPLPLVNKSAGKGGAINRSIRENIEKELAGSFAQFVFGEVERLTSKEKKDKTVNKEKNDRLHDFKRFSQGYKINAPVPPDLIPILSKDKEKQEEILQRASANARSSKESSAASTPLSNLSPAVSNASGRGSRENSVSTKPPQKAVAEVAAPAAAAATASASTSKPADKKPKFNFNAREFKPNPSASSFVPSFGASSSVPAAAPTFSPPVQAPPVVKTSASQPPQPLFTKTAKSKSWDKLFNPFITARMEYEEKTKAKEGETVSVFVIERAFVTGPTWNGTVDASYTTLLGGDPGYGRSPAAGGGIPYGRADASGGFPAMGNMMGVNMVPMMQPAFDDREGGPLNGNSPLPTVQIIPGMMSGYPQYAVPQYYGRPPQPMVTNPMLGYVPNMGSPRMPPNMMAQQGYYYPQQQQPPQHFNGAPPTYPRQGGNSPMHGHPSPHHKGG